MWKFSIFLVLIIVLIPGCNLFESTSKLENWDVSPTFQIIVTFGDGVQGEYIFIGEKNKLALLIGTRRDEENIRPFIAGKPDKYMWHFWGDDQDLIGNFKVIAKNKDTGQEIEVVKSSEFNQLTPQNGADHVWPTNLTFPYKGLWKLEAYINESLFGTLIIEVKEET